MSKIVLITSTNSDGTPTVVTSYTYVEPARNTAPPSGTQSGKPGLQTNAANRHRVLEAAVAGGAVGGVFAFFL